MKDQDLNMFLWMSLLIQQVSNQLKISNYTCKISSFKQLILKMKNGFQGRVMLTQFSVMYIVTNCYQLALDETILF